MQNQQQRMETVRKLMEKERKLMNWDVLADKSSLSDNRGMAPKGTKNDEGKPKLALIPYVALEAEGMAFLYGETKYGKHNYKQGMEALRLASAALRHVHKWIAGAELDEESGIHHLGHARASLAMLMELQRSDKLIDDRES